LIIINVSFVGPQSNIFFLQIAAPSVQEILTISADVVEGEEREEVDEDDATFTRGEDSTNQGRKKSSDYLCFENS
jgi:hypothetical protein